MTVVREMTLSQLTFTVRAGNIGLDWIRGNLDFDMSALMLAIGPRPECQNIHFVNAELDATDRKVTLSVEPFFNNLFA